MPFDSLLFINNNNLMHQREVKVVNIFMAVCKFYDLHASNYF